jgi:hypothetical protein
VRKRTFNLVQFYCSIIKNPMISLSLFDYWPLTRDIEVKAVVKEFDSILHNYSLSTAYAIQIFCSLLIVAVALTSSASFVIMINRFDHNFLRTNLPQVFSYFHLKALTKICL